MSPEDHHRHEERTLGLSASVDESNRNRICQRLSSCGRISPKPPSGSPRTNICNHETSQTPPSDRASPTFSMKGFIRRCQSDQQQQQRSESASNMSPDSRQLHFSPSSSRRSEVPKALVTPTESTSTRVVTPMIQRSQASVMDASELVQVQGIFLPDPTGAPGRYSGTVSK